ncbi:MAG: hypothetical protein IT385_17755 [Deltaproteobacteria bacterium]|nr:hypothetical protein [Deltaproteobacteria bacterium]
MTLCGLMPTAPQPAPRDIAGDAMRTDFERVGGEAGLRALITEFVGRTFADPMIGFLFAGKPKARITELEYRFAAEHLGAPLVYDGRPLGEAHRRSPISGGHFDRRTRILAETLARHEVPDDVAARWLAHVESRRSEVLERRSVRSTKQMLGDASSARREEGAYPAYVTDEQRSDAPQIPASARESELIGAPGSFGDACERP